MKLTKTLLSVIAIFVFVSCQKELDTTIDPIDPVLNARVKTYVEDITSGGNHSVATFNIAYDPDGKMISMTSAENAGDRFEFKYFTGNYTMDLYNSNELSIHEVFYLSNDLLIDSTLQYDDSKDSLTEKYAYNSAKQLLSIKQYDYSQATGAVLFNTNTYTYDDNGNVVKDADNNSVTTYEYYPDLLNTLALGNPYFPVNKQLVKTTTVTEGGSSVSLNHAYTFDASKRISTEKITTGSGEVAIKTYTYY